MHETSPVNRAFVLLIDGYRTFLSPLLPGRCRFYPSCSAYAKECFHVFPFYRAIPKAAWRILRCNPFNEGYFDPVLPETRSPHLNQQDRS